MKYTRELTQRATAYKSILLAIIILVVSSCKTLKEAPGTIVREVDGRKLVEIKNENITIKYAGDYWFHNLNPKIIPGWNENILKSFKQKNIKKPIILYVAHTTVDPYYSTIALSYDSLCAESDFANKISESLKSCFWASKSLSNLMISKEDFGEVQAIKLSYELYNDKQRIWTRQIEYIISAKKRTLRIIFSTINYSVDLFESEATNILKTIKIN